MAGQSDKSGMTPSDYIESGQPVRTDGLHAVFGNAWSKLMGGAIVQDHQDAPMVLVALFEIEAWRPWLGDAMCLLSQAERSRVERKLRKSDRDELVLAYALHRLVLGSFLSCDPVKIELERDTRGRPFVRGDELCTSLSHTHGAVAVAVSCQGFVGIDIEPATRAKELPGIASSVLHPVEAEVLSSFPEKIRGEALLALWVRKEALLKASGIGLMREMHSFVAPVGQPVGLPAVDGTEGAAATLHMLETGSRWVAAIAAVPEAGFQVCWLLPESTLSAF